jgi:hypothetical protein
MTEYPASAVDEHNSKFIAEFRASGGQVSGPQYQGVDLLLLHHTRGPQRPEARHSARLPARAGLQPELKAAPRRIPVVVLDPVRY